MLTFKTARQLEHLAQTFVALGGVARTARLLDEGVSRHTLRIARDEGLLQPLRRGWVAAPGADAELVAAARWGVVLTCVTAARRHGLWVLTEDRCHVACGPHATGPRPDRATVHWARPVMQRDPDDLVDPLPNALVLVATCVPHEQALVIWESAFRLRRVDPTVLARTPLPPAARRLLAEARPFADSGLETLFVVRLRWLPIPITPQVWIAGRPVDFLIGDRLVVQLDGGHHVGAQRARDNAHDAELMLLGYHIIRVGYSEMLEEWPAVQRRILDAIAQGLHLAR
ncbi:DUF559 domain-containing protein [Microbacterium invictum]|uniref:DUF559 domain-containing protein n=1 Tax=Microbacterium invictum TaxID=515415 RepID=A0ABZ0V693_9MICO|nr:DUF559 domain-containing protein [Microbacterium invictum]WQB69118.1 DUF559 domain-containing protein [Microbacterium invictum]